MTISTYEFDLDKQVIFNYSETDLPEGHFLHKFTRAARKIGRKTAALRARINPLVRPLKIDLPGHVGV